MNWDILRNNENWWNRIKKKLHETWKEYWKIWRKLDIQSVFISNFLGNIKNSLQADSTDVCLQFPYRRQQHQHTKAYENEIQMNWDATHWTELHFAGHN